jgi:hypothetical protein
MLIIYLLVLFILFILCYIIFRGYIKIKMNFWALQPIFHIYNILYWISPPGIINKEYPKINKYTNLINIKTYGISEINETLLERICNFIKIYYIQSQNTKYIPSKKNIIEYLLCNNNESYLTIYQKPKLLFDKNEPAVNVNDIISVITARSLNITFKNKAPFFIYYVDNLCVHPDYRKHGIAPETIQTHYYNLRANNDKIQVCLFKREGKLNAIVPLTAYETICFNIDNIPQLNTNIQQTQFINVIEIGVSQISLLLDFIHSQKEFFDCIIMPDVSNIINMIKTENIFIYGIIDNNELISVYVFKKPNLYYNNVDEAIECLMTLNNNNNNNNNNNDNDKINSKFNNETIFINGFNISLNKIKEKLKTTILLLENTGNSNIVYNYLHENIQQKYILFKSPTAFFFYNYGCYSIPKNKLLILY